VSTHFSAAIVSHNEAHHLRDCLDRLRFCDEIVVVDFQSSDDSVAVAESFGARVVSRESVLNAERLRGELIGLVRNDWVILCDPDEILPHGVEHAALEAIEANPRLGLIGVPIRYFFRGHRLECTEWGRRRPKFFIAHRDRCESPPYVHAGLEPRPGFERGVIGEGDFEIEHRWIDSLSQMIEKHARYLKVEGEARHARGDRFSWSAAGRATWGCLRGNLLDHGGLAAGPTGWFLSAFHAGYTALAWRSLRRYERGPN